jgi:hypothetical protein
MISFLTTVDASELKRVSRNLEAYAKVRYKRTEDQILNDKGTDLRIQLFRQFFSHRFILKKAKNTALAGVIRSLVAGGRGIRVRLQALRSPFDAKIPSEDKNGRPLTMRQKLVAQEVLRRIVGSGVLGVSFLGKRWRFNKKGAYLVQNKTNTMGVSATFEKKDGQYIISGFTPGLARVASKYGVLSNALAVVSSDIENYLRKKIGPELLAAIHAP